MSFLHAKLGTKITLPQTNGSIYAFGRDVNIEWKHGILQAPPELHDKEAGRISIIAWGWVDMCDISPLAPIPSSLLNDPRVLALNSQITNSTQTTRQNTTEANSQQCAKKKENLTPSQNAVPTSSKTFINNDPTSSLKVGKEHYIASNNPNDLPNREHQDIKIAAQNQLSGTATVVDNLSSTVIPSVTSSSPQIGIRPRFPSQLQLRVRAPLSQSVAIRPSLDATSALCNPTGTRTIHGRLLSKPVDLSSLHGTPSLQPESKNTHALNSAHTKDEKTIRADEFIADMKPWSNTD